MKHDVSETEEVWKRLEEKGRAEEEREGGEGGEVGGGGGGVDGGMRQSSGRAGCSETN